MIQSLIEEIILYSNLAQIVKEYKGPPVVPEDPSTNQTAIAVGLTLIVLLVLIISYRLFHHRKSNRKTHR